MTTKRELTDIELCGLLEADAETNYRRALDVMTAYPDYALTQFRIVAERLVHLLVERFRIESNQENLFLTINGLCECQVIDRGLRSAFHDIRSRGNRAVHSDRRSSSPPQASNELLPESVNTAGDLEAAIDARKTLVGIFESVYLLLNKGQQLPKVTLVAVDDHTSQQTLWKAVTSLDFASKLAAGLILEAQSKACFNKDVLIARRIEVVHKVTNERMAAEMYWAACAISAGLDSIRLVEIGLNGGEEATLLKRADTEALYRYGLLTYDLGEGEERQRLGALAIEEAARRRYAPACTHYGDFLRQKGRYDEAFAMLQNAAAQEDITAFVGLSILYCEEGCPYYSPEKAVESLQAGIDRNSHHCEYVLGRMLYEGKQVNADRERGIKLLEDAVAGGDWSAKAYLELCVDDKFAKLLQRQFLDSFGPFLSGTVSPKLGRNDPCHCGSGKKFKKCCGA